jgi:hypothetical protein
MRFVNTTTNLSLYQKIVEKTVGLEGLAEMQKNAKMVSYGNNFSHRNIRFFKRSIKHPLHRNPWDLIESLQKQVMMEGRAGSMDLVVR